MYLTVQSSPGRLAFFPRMLQILNLCSRVVDHLLVLQRWPPDRGFGVGILSAPPSCSALDDPGLCACCPRMLTSVLDALAQGFLPAFPYAPISGFYGPEPTLQSLQPGPVSPAIFVFPVLRSCPVLDDPVQGHSSSSPGCSSPGRRLLAALLCPGRTSLWRQSALP